MLLNFFRSRNNKCTILSRSLLFINTWNFHENSPYNTLQHKQALFHTHYLTILNNTQNLKYKKENEQELLFPRKLYFSRQFFFYYFLKIQMRFCFCRKMHCIFQIKIFRICHKSQRNFHFSPSLHHLFFPPFFIYYPNTATQFPTHTISLFFAPLHTFQTSNNLLFPTFSQNPTQNDWQTYVPTTSRYNPKIPIFPPLGPTQILNIHTPLKLSLYIWPSHIYDFPWVGKTFSQKLDHFATL